MPRTKTVPTKRTKTQKIPRTMVVYKPEMKNQAANLSYASQTFAALSMVQVAPGTNRQSRIGNKIKIHAIELLITSTGANAIRCDIVEPFDGTTAPSYTYDGILDRSTNSQREF